jgi:hypothetical protein
MLSETDKHQARQILSRMFQYGQDGRDLGRYLLAELGKPDGDYMGMKQELLTLLSGMLDSLYLAEKPRQS